MAELECRVCKRQIMEGERCLGLMYGRNSVQLDGFASDDDDQPDVLCLGCENIVYDAIENTVVAELKALME